MTAATGTIVPGFPATFQGLNFLSAPIFADVTGDGLAEIVDGGDSNAMHAFMTGGLQAALARFPKFTNGWVLWSPAAGDLDSDGTTEIVIPGEAEAMDGLHVDLRERRITLLVIGAAVREPVAGIGGVVGEAHALGVAGSICGDERHCGKRDDPGYGPHRALALVGDV